jgi:flagellar hook-length control protein FliK
VTFLNLVQSVGTVSTADASPDPNSLSLPASEDGEERPLPAPLPDAPPVSALETGGVVPGKQASSAGNTQSVTDAAVADEDSAAPLSIVQETSVELGALANISQDKNTDPASAGDVAPLTSQLLEAHGREAAQSVSPAIPRTNSRTARRDEKALAGEQGQQPLTTALSLSEMAPAITAQLLATQPTPAPSNAATPLAAGDPQNEAPNFAEAPKPDDAKQEIGGSQKQADAATSSKNQDAANLLADVTAAPFSNSAPQSPDPMTQSTAASPDTAENIKPSAAEIPRTPIFSKPGDPEATTAGDAAFLVRQQSSAPASPTATSEPETTVASAQGDDDVSSDHTLTNAFAGAKPKGDPKPAIQPTADAAQTASAGDGTEKPGDTGSADVSKSAVEAAVTNALTRPAESVARDAASATAPAGAVSPDLSGRPAALSRTARAPVRSNSSVNRDAQEAQSQSPSSSASDSAPMPEKSRPNDSIDSAQNIETPKTISQAGPNHIAESTPDSDASKGHDPLDSGAAADSVQPQAARAEAQPAPAAPQPQPAVLEIVLPAAVTTHGFEVPLVSAGTPHRDDVPVTFAFNAPDAPDRSAFDALALRIASHSSDGDRHFSIRLDPPELGKIEVNLNVDAHGHAQAELSADKPQTLELLQKDASTLERALKDTGLNLSGGLAFSLKGEGRSQAWRDSQNGRSRSLQIAGADAASANAALTARAALAAQAYGLPTSQLDIRV